VVAATEPCRAIWRAKHGLLLTAIERGDEFALGLFGRDRKYALAQGAVRWLFKRHEPRERVDRCEPGIASAGGIAALDLEMLQEGRDQRGIERCERERRGWLANALLRTRAIGGTCRGTRPRCWGSRFAAAAGGR